MATAVMGRVVGLPVLYQRKEMLHALDQTESSVVLVLGSYAASSRQRKYEECVHWPQLLSMFIC